MKELIEPVQSVHPAYVDAYKKKYILSEGFTIESKDSLLDVRVSLDSIKEALPHLGRRLLSHTPIILGSFATTIAVLSACYYESDITDLRTTLATYRDTTEKQVSTLKHDVHSVKANAITIYEKVETQNKNVTGLASAMSRIIKQSVIPAQAHPVHRYKDSNSISNTNVITVAAKKVNLRTGPGFEHSPAMNVSEGTRLVSELSDGEWLRVISPEGSRMWVHESVVE